MRDRPKLELVHSNVRELRREKISDAIHIAFPIMEAKAACRVAMKEAERQGNSDAHFALTRIAADLDEVSEDVLAGNLGPKGAA